MPRNFGDATTEMEFTCKDCGSHELIVEREYVLVTPWEHWLTCDCGTGQNGIAALRTGETSTSYQVWGQLDEDHRVDWDNREKLDDGETEADQNEVFCSACLEGADELCWDYEEEEGEEKETEYWVRCSGCKREIEFGWSHPDRGGRIWPAECSDFNPWKSWPEPRYRESWEKKSWIRPDFRGKAHAHSNA